MKLRNKKTGEIALVNNFLVCDVFSGYKTLSDFLEDWEDSEPKEPLIKDKKVCKAVRAWAEANDMSSDSVVICGSFDDGFETDTSSIEFDCTIRDALRGLKRGKSYTIAELCGEEEE